MSDCMVVACLPAYNEESHIASLIIRIKNYVDKIIVCDDGSSDLTADIAEDMGVIVVRHGTNQGYGAALKSLFKEAYNIGADIIVTIDADNQHDPSEINRLVEVLKETDADIVIGSRFVEGGVSDVPEWRKRGIEVLNSLSTKGEGLTDSQSGFRAYTRTTIEALDLSEDGMGISTEILIKAIEKGLKIIEVPITVKYFEDSSTHNPLVHGVGVLLTTIKYLSTRRPLLLYGVPGFVLCVSSLFIWGYTFQLYSISNYFSTNYALIALTLTLIGLTLISTSMIIWSIASMKGNGDKTELKKD